MNDPVEADHRPCGDCHVVARASQLVENSRLLLPEKREGDLTASGRGIDLGLEPLLTLA